MSENGKTEGNRPCRFCKSIYACYCCGTCGYNVVLGHKEGCESDPNGGSK